jgi:rubrerythrin
MDPAATARTAAAAETETPPPPPPPPPTTTIPLYPWKRMIRRLYPSTYAAITAETASNLVCQALGHLEAAGSRSQTLEGCWREITWPCPCTFCIWARASRRSRSERDLRQVEQLWQIMKVVHDHWLGCSDDRCELCDESKRRRRREARRRRGTKRKRSDKRADKKAVARALAQANEKDLAQALTKAVMARARAEARAEAESAGERDRAAQCVVCLDAPRTEVLLPCRHVAMCESCTQQVMRSSTSGKCPTCRATIDSHMRIYLS